MEYNKFETVEKYGTVMEEDKSVAHSEKVAEDLWQLLLGSPYSKGELIECLGFGDWKVDRLLAGDEKIGLYEITHIAGALGYSFDITFKPLDVVDKPVNILHSIPMWKLF